MAKATTVVSSEASATRTPKQAIEQVLSEMNLDALYLVCEGEHDAAANLLLDCLAKARRRDMEMAVSHPYYYSRHGTVDATSSATTTNTIIDTIPLMGAMGPNEDWTGYAANHFVFYRNLFATELPDNYAAWDRETLLSFIIMVMYNLAVIKHELGLVEENMEVLMCARTLYKFALDLVGQAVVSANNVSGCAIDMNVLAVAIYNNLGHLFSFIGDDQQGILQCRMGLETHIPVITATLNTGCLSLFHESLSLSCRFNDPSRY